MSRLLFGHTFALVLAVSISILLREPMVPETAPGGSSTLGQGVVIAGFWLVMLQVAGSFDVRSLGTGAEEFKRIARATARTLACAAIVAWGLDIEISRWLVALVLPIGFAFICVSALLCRRWLHGLRGRGEGNYSVLAVGSRDNVEQLVTELRYARFAGLEVVGACVPDNDGLECLLDTIPVLGKPEDAASTAARKQIDVVAVAGTAGLPTSFLRRLGWDLEGSGRKLLVATGMVNTAGPRISVIPVAGVPLVWVDEPMFTGWRRITKRGFDLLVTTLLLVLASPLLLLTALAIKVDSAGPVFFRQLRTGMHGEPFRVWKFRSMHADAEERRTALQTYNESDGHLFKIRDDPRVTRVGRLIRRTSIDELPQLFNVLAGTMSLVGPRPLPVTDSTYQGHARRRLLVLPGITGLWQVQGRSQTTWDEAMRLDLYYVENWSLSLDLVILARTVTAVIRGDGAY